MAKHKVKALIEIVNMKSLQIVGSVKRQRVIPVLCYHSIDETDALGSVQPGDFAGQMHYLREKGYRSIPLSELVKILLRTNQRRVEKYVVITFDDGFESVYRNAFGVLKECGFTATVFLATKYIGKKAGWVNDLLEKAGSGSGFSARGLNDSERGKTAGKDGSAGRQVWSLCGTRTCWLGRKRMSELCLMSWAEAKDMASYGIDFGAHTVSHAFLTRLGTDEAREEICRSKSVLEEKLGREVTVFSYPYGDYDGDIVELVKKSGFAGACSARFGISHSARDLYRLKRISLFNTRLSGYLFRFLLR